MINDYVFYENEFGKDVFTDAELPLILRTIDSVDKMGNTNVNFQ